MLQHVVPRQTGEQTAQVGDEDVGTDAFETVHAAEEADRRYVARRVAQRDDMDWKAAPVRVDTADDARFDAGSGVVDQAFDFVELADSGCAHGVPARALFALQQILNVMLLVVCLVSC